MIGVRKSILFTLIFRIFVVFWTEDKLWQNSGKWGIHALSHLSFPEWATLLPFEVRSSERCLKKTALLLGHLGEHSSFTKDGAQKIRDACMKSRQIEQLLYPFVEHFSIWCWGWGCCSVSCHMMFQFIYSMQIYCCLNLQFRFSSSVFILCVQCYNPSTQIVIGKYLCTSFQLVAWIWD